MPLPAEIGHSYFGLTAGTFSVDCAANIQYTSSAVPMRSPAGEIAMNAEDFPIISLVV